MKKKLIQHYRGVQPATIVNVMEGDGTEENPARVAQYVIMFENVAGVQRQKTLGTIMPLTNEEESWLKLRIFDPLSTQSE